MKRAAVPALCAMIILSSSTASSAPVTISFTGTVTSATGEWIGQGSAVTGTVVYEDDLTELQPGPSGPDNDFFVPDLPQSNFGRQWEIAVTVGAVSRTTADQVIQNPGSEGRHHELEFFDRAGLDEFEINSTGPFFSSADAGIVLRAFDMLYDTGDNLTGTSNTVIALDLSSPSLVIGRYEFFDAGGMSEGRVNFSVDSAVVPEPSGVGAFIASLSTLAGLRAFRRRRRTSP